MNPCRPRVQREEVSWDNYKQDDMQAGREGIAGITPDNLHILKQSKTLATRCNT